jgi:hypothetical protein
MVFEVPDGPLLLGWIVMETELALAGIVTLVPIAG